MSCAAKIWALLWSVVAAFGVLVLLVLDAATDEHEFPEDLSEMFARRDARKKRRAES